MLYDDGSLEDSYEGDTCEEAGKPKCEKYQPTPAEVEKHRQDATRKMDKKRVALGGGDQKAEADAQEKENAKVVSICGGKRMLHSRKRRKQQNNDDAKGCTRQQHRSSGGSRY